MAPRRCVDERAGQQSTLDCAIVPRCTRSAQARMHERMFAHGGCSHRCRAPRNPWAADVCRHTPAIDAERYKIPQQMAIWLSVIAMVVVLAATVIGTVLVDAANRR